MTQSSVQQYSSPGIAQRRLGALGITLVVLLIAAAVLNYLDRLAISTLGPVLKDAFKLNNEKWGLVNSAFSLVYIFTSFFGGAWIDRVGVRKGLTISVIVWAIAAIGHSFAHGFASLCFWRMMLALGEGPGTTAMAKGVRRLMPPRLRDVGNGLISAGWAAGALISPLVVDPISRHFGWHAAFLVTGGSCFLWLPAWVGFSFRKSATLGPERMHLIVGSDDHPEQININSYAMWAALAGIFFTVPATAFVNSFLPVFLHDARGLSQQQYSRLYWQPFLFTDIGQLLGGVMVYALLRCSWRYLTARRIVMIVGFCGSACMLAVKYHPDVHQTMRYINLSRFFFQIGYTALVAYGLESVAESQTALMAGIMNAVFSACNLVFNPVIGRMADRDHTYGHVLIMIAISPIVGLILWGILSEMHARRERRGEM